MPTPNRNLTKNHPANQIIGSKEKGVRTRNKLHEKLYFISQVEPMSVDEACKDNHWIKEMKEE